MDVCMFWCMRAQGCDELLNQNHTRACKAMSACRFSAILFHPDGSKALPRVSNPKAQKCTNPTFLGVITGILWWALREPGQGHITMALDQAEQIAKEDPGLHLLNFSVELRVLLECTAP